MPAPIALQLYTIRDLLEGDFEGGVRRVADMGYAGVEPAGFPGSSPEAASALFKELGLEVCSAHVPLPLGDAKQQTLDIMAALGATRMVAGKGPEQFATHDLIKASCDEFNAVAAVAREHGMSFAMHNHWWEFERIDGRPVYQVMLEHLEPDVLFELDVYWVQTGGCDPVAVLKELGARAPLLHIKDGPCVKGAPMTAVGAGDVDTSAVVAAGEAAEWLIVELDACATDMMTAVGDSYTYMTSEGLARGR